MSLQLTLSTGYPVELPRVLPTYATPDCSYESMLPDLPQASIDWLRAELIRHPLKPKQLDRIRWPEGGPDVWLYGLPKHEKCTLRRMRLAIRDCISQLKGRELGAVALNCRPFSWDGIEGVDLIEFVGVEAALAAYDWDECRSQTPGDEQKVRLTHITLRHPDAEAAPDQFAAALHSTQAIIDGLQLARDLSNRPANLLFPATFAEAAQSLESSGVTVTIHAEPELEAMSAFPGGRAGLLLATGGASAHGPRLVVLEFHGGNADQAPLALVGKGITFDTGGLNVKPWKGMRDMYLDMMGAAAVVGAMQAIAQMKLPIHVVGVCAVAENAIGPNAMRPSDVLTALDGTRVEIAHTDAEGRLVLADALAYAVATFAPAVMVDAATLTGSVMAALGSGRGGVFSKDDELANQLLAIGERVGEPYWRLPMTEEYDDIAESSRGDVSNIGKMDPYGDAIAGAYFLHHFVKSTRWAHLDIASIDHFDKSSGLNTEFSSGAATRIFIALAREMARSAT